MKHADLGLNLTTKRTRKRDFLGVNHTGFRGGSTPERIES